MQGTFTLVYVESVEATACNEVLDHDRMWNVWHIEVRSHSSADTNGLAVGPEFISRMLVEPRSDPTAYMASQRWSCKPVRQLDRTERVDEWVEDVDREVGDRLPGTRLLGQVVDRSPAGCCRGFGGETVPGLAALDEVDVPEVA